MNDLVSVIIPTYNRSAILLEAVDSVLKQSHQNFELWVVDDGSTDNTRQIIEQIADRRVFYLFQENAGPAAARNTGIGKARGKYIAFLDSDDLWHPRKLEKQMAVFRKESGVGLISTWSTYLNSEGRFLFKKSCRAKDTKDYLKYLLLHPDKAFTGTPTLLVKKECFDRVGLFDEGQLLFEDWDLCFRIGLHFDIRVINEPLTTIRTDEQSFSSLSDEPRFKTMHLRYLEKAFGQEGLPEEILKIKSKSYSNAFLSLGHRALYRSKNKRRAREFFSQSLRCDPWKILNPGFSLALSLSLLPRIFLDAYKKIRQSRSR